MIIILKRTLYQKEFGNKINKTANTLSLIQPQIQKKQQEITSGNNLLGLFTGKNRENNATAARYGQIKAGGAGSEADRAARAKSGTTTIADQQANMIRDARAARHAGSRAIVDTSRTTGSTNNDQIIRGSQNIKGKTIDSTSTFKGTLKLKGRRNQEGKNQVVTRKVAVRSMDDSTVTNGTVQERLAKLSPERRALLDARVKARKEGTAIPPTSTTPPKPATIIPNNNVNKKNVSTSIGSIQNNNTAPKPPTIIPNNNVNKQNKVSTSIGSIQNNSIVPKPPTNQNNGSILSGLRKDASNTWNSLKQGATNTWNGMSTASKRMLTGAAIIGGGLMIANSIRRRRQAEEDARMARRYGRYY